MADVVLWEDTFEGGAALATDYTGIANAETAAAIGVGATRGARTTGTSSQKYNGEFRKHVTTPANERTFFIEGDFDLSSAGEQTGGHYVLEIRNVSFGGSFFISVYADVNTDALRVYLHNDVDFPDPEYDTANSVYTVSTFLKLRLEGTLSTVDGVTFESNADGEFRLYSAAPGPIVGDFDHGAATLLLSQTGVHIMTDVDDPAWDRGVWGPMGNVDNIRLGYMTVTPDPIIGSTVFGTVGTVTSTRTFLANLDETTRTVHEPGTFYIGGDLIVTGTTTLGAVTPGSVGLDDLSDVAITSPATNQQLAYNGSAWVNTAHVGSPAVAAGNSGTTKTLDWNSGNNQLLTLTDNCTLTLSNPKDGFTYVIALKQDGAGSRTVTWPAAVKWAGAAAPTLTTTAGRVDLVRLTYFAALGASGNYVAEFVLNYTPA